MLVVTKRVLVVTIVINILEHKIIPRRRLPHLDHMSLVLMVDHILVLADIEFFASLVPDKIHKLDIPKKLKFRLHRNLG